MNSRPHDRPLTDRTLNYPEVGATRLGPLPDGYHHLHHTTRIGRGRAVFEAAGAAVTDLADAPRLGRPGAHRRRCGPSPAPGVEVSLGVGPLRFTAPCEVIWTAYERDRTGFAYGTLTGHPECGEESLRRRHPRRRLGVVHRHGLQPSGQLVHPARRSARARPAEVRTPGGSVTRVRRLAADADTGGDGVVHATVTTG